MLYGFKHLQIEQFALEQAEEVFRNSIIQMTGYSETVKKKRGKKPG